MVEDGKRRLAAILAADAAGYARLMQADEEATIAALRAARAVFREHVESHGGRLVDTAGDSVLAVFASVLDAVRAALAVQETLGKDAAEVAEDRRMRFRVGVNLGDVVEHADGTVYGDGVNIAARLESLAEPGGVTVSGTVHDSIEGKLALGFADQGSHRVKNIDRPVRAFRLVPDGAAAPAARAKSLPRPVVIAAAALVAVVGAVVISQSLLAPDEADVAQPPADLVSTMPTGPAVAVLPFDNLSGDPEQEYLADGIAEDIITRLARFPVLGVIARNSSFQYKGESVDVRSVAEDLGATYVLEGSVRRSETRVRVTAQLLDATDGTHLWAETYDRELSAGDIFAIQDDITERVVGAIASGDSIIAQEVVQATASKAPTDLASYECVIRSGEYWRAITPDVHLSARTCLESVLSNEPDYASAWTSLAGITIDEFLYGYNPRPGMAPELDRAQSYAERAIEIDPKLGWAHWNLGKVAYYRHNMSLFHSEIDRALELLPNDAQMLAAAGHFLAYSGSWERGILLMKKAIKLNSHHQSWYHFPFFYDAYRRRNDEAALEAAQRLDMPGFFWTHQVLAAAYGQLGMASEAAAAVDTLRELYPGYSVRTMTDMHRLWNFEEDVIARMADGLRKAGLPEGDS